MSLNHCQVTIKHCASLSVWYMVSSCLALALHWSNEPLWLSQWQCGGDST